MPTPAQGDLLPAGEAVRSTTLAYARNSLRYGTFGELETTGETLERLIEAIPETIARALRANAFLFVPLALGETAFAHDTEIARVYSGDLADRATCHRTVPIEGSTYTFISTRLMQDRFALAFELFINVGHQYVDLLAATKSAPPERLTSLFWQQALADVRGETSQDSYEARKRALELAGEGSPKTANRATPHTSGPREFEEQRTRFYEAAFSDTLAIYMLSLAIDFDYTDLREREYPLLAAPALAERLRVTAELFPPNAGYEFSVRYRRRH